MCAALGSPMNTLMRPKATPPNDLSFLFHSGNLFHATKFFSYCLIDLNGVSFNVGEGTGWI